MVKLKLSSDLHFKGILFPPPALSLIIAIKTKKREWREGFLEFQAFFVKLQRNQNIESKRQKWGQKHYVVMATFCRTASSCVIESFDLKSYM